ncbi:hypothetical protein U91I_01182 [alpha proteobacterium U9-1i]|nr:hypothetical protein U91I_01182 [alpha proteobacterium U9-1i]
MSIEQIVAHVKAGDDEARSLEDRLASYESAQAVAKEAGVITVVEFFPESQPPLKFDFLQERIDKLKLLIDLANWGKERP